MPGEIFVDSCLVTTYWCSQWFQAISRKKMLLFRELEQLLSDGYGGLIPPQTPKHQVRTKTAGNINFMHIFNDWNKTEQTTKNYTIPAVLQIGYFQQGIKYRLELNQGITFYKKLVGYTNDRKGDQNGTAKCKGWILPNAVDFNLKQGSFQYQPKQSTMCFSTGNPFKTSYICI